MVLFYSKADMCMDNNGKDTKHIRNIARIMRFVRNSEKCRIHDIYGCEGGLQLVDITTNIIGEHDLTPRMKYMMVRLENWGRSIIQEG